jgi:cofilin
MDTGIPISDDCNHKFLELQRKKAYRFITFDIQDNKEVVVRSTADRSATVDDFFKALGPNPCYGVIDYEFAEDGCNKSKIIFVAYIPDETAPKARLVYAGTKAKLKEALGVAQNDLHASSRADLTEDNLKSKLK